MIFFRELAIPGILAGSAFAIFHYSASAGLPGGHYASYASGVAAWLALAWLGARLVDIFLRRAAATAHPPRLLNDLLHAALYTIAGVAILVFVFEQQATGLIATSSVLIAVVGFGLRNIMSDAFSGIALNLDHPYRIGDWIEPANGVFGRVTEITWRTTRVVTRDGTTVIVPNGVIAGSRVINYSEPDPSFRITLRLWLDPKLPVERIKKILLTGAFVAMRQYPEMRPDVLVQEVGESGVLYLVRFWVADGDHENACRDAVVTAIMQTLQRHGLALSPPRREVTWIEADRSLLQPSLAAVRRDSVLDHCDLFSIFTAEERATISQELIEHRLEKGDVVFDRGAVGGTLFCVAEGAVEVTDPATMVSPGVVFDRLVPGDVFGEISLLTGELRSATVVALTDAVLYEVTKEVIEPLLRTRPELFDKLAALMVERQKRNKDLIREGMSNATEISKDDWANRIRNFFSFKSKYS